MPIPASASLVDSQPDRTNTLKREKNSTAKQMRNHLQSSAAFYINVYLADRVYFMYNSGCGFRFCILEQKRAFLQNSRAKFYIFLQNWPFMQNNRYGAQREWGQPHAHSAASYHTFSKAEQAPAPLQNRAFLCQQTM